MKLKELQQIVEKQESMGLTTSILSLTRPKNYVCKSGYVRTPFGSARLCAQEIKDDKCILVVMCDVKKMRKVLNKLTKDKK